MSPGKGPVPEAHGRYPQSLVWGQSCALSLFESWYVWNQRSNWGVAVPWERTNSKSQKTMLIYHNGSWQRGRIPEGGHSGASREEGERWSLKLPLSIEEAAAGISCGYAQGHAVGIVGASGGPARGRYPPETWCYLSLNKVPSVYQETERQHSITGRELNLHVWLLPSLLTLEVRQFYGL